jgi:DNA primase
VISLYDADKAGLTATERNLGNFLREGLESKVVVLPGAKDPDSLLHDESKSPEERKKILVTAFDESILAVDYLVQNTVLPEKNAQTRGKKLRALVDILDQVPDEIERTVFKKDIAKRFELPESMLFATQAPISPAIAPMGASKTSAKTAISNDRWEREILKFLILYGEIEAFALSETLAFLCSSSKWGNLILRLAELGLESKTIAQLKWLEEVEPELQTVIREWVLEVKQEPVHQVSKLLWSDLVRGLKRSYVQRESERIQKDLIAAEKEQNLGRVRSLLSEKQSLVRMIQLQ